MSDSPANIKLDVGVEQSNYWGSGSPPPAHSGPDQTLLLGVPHHLNESWTLAVCLGHEILQLLLQLIYKTHRRMNFTWISVAQKIPLEIQGEESRSCLWANFHPQNVIVSSSSGFYFIGRRPNVLMLRCFDRWTKEAAALASTADLRGARRSKRDIAILRNQPAMPFKPWGEEMEEDCLVKYLASKFTSIITRAV